MSGNHNTIIAAKAKAALDELGFSRHGRSRLWIADNQSWLNLVEFTPDRWSKGISLMNAVHWLWAGTGFLTFNEAVPSKSHAEFETNEQFDGVISHIVREAASKAGDLNSRFSSFDRTAEFVIDRARSSPERMQPSWWGYEAGIASALLNKLDDAEFFLSAITDERVLVHSLPLLPFVRSPDKFKSRANDLIVRQREALSLTPLERQPF
jgi:hypothetical protein